MWEEQAPQSVLPVAFVGTVPGHLDPNHILPTALHSLSDHALDKHKLTFILTKGNDGLSL